MGLRREQRSALSAAQGMAQLSRFFETLSVSISTRYVIYILSYQTFKASVHGMPHFPRNARHCSPSPPHRPLDALNGPPALQRPRTPRPHPERVLLPLLASRMVAPQPQTPRLRPRLSPAPRRSARC